MVATKDVLTPCLLDISDLTETTLEGNGVLDIMLRTMRTHLESEYDKNRIRGPEYATVYLGAFTAVLSEATRFTLERLKLGAELDLIHAQTNQVKQNANKIPHEISGIQAQNKLTLMQVSKIEEDLKKSPYELELVLKQLETAVLQNKLIEHQNTNAIRQLEKIPHEINILQQQAKQAVHQTNLVDAQAEQIRLENTKIPHQIEALKATVEIEQAKVEVAIAEALQAEAQLEKIPHEIDLVKAQAVLTYRNASKVDADICLLDEQIKLAKEELALKRLSIEVKLKELDLLLAQIEAQKAQSDLYKQKVITEKAQTDPKVIGDGSVIDRQNDLVLAQTYGYHNDHLLKSANQLINTWVIRRQTDEGTSANPENNLVDTTIGHVVNKLIQSIDKGALDVTLTGNP